MQIAKFEQITKQYQVEDIFEWRKWAGEIPYLKFPRTWLVKVVPPYAGAITRFHVTTEKIEALNVNPISVYLDAYQTLGFWPTDEPYWEIYPYKDDISRYAMSDTKNLIKDIGKALKSAEKFGEKIREKNKNT